ncbi:MAG: nucleoside-diphosphate sugar epimerase [Dethiosulfovibrio peptidovorans]|nr:MAG: nucleoside-diphosphate sugar epimerase [Dethiosulfovibrio peptidovorans]
MTTGSKGPSLVVILSDGIRGHLFQSRGVASHLAELCGAFSVEMNVPSYKGCRRFWVLKVLGRALLRAGSVKARRWLRFAGSDAQTLLSRYRMALDERGVSGKESLVISAGSSAAPLTLALARAMGGKSCTLMTPSILGTSPFDYAVVPSHDGTKNGRILETLGAPNSVNRSNLADQAQEMLNDYPGDDVRWGVLVGGDDQNYRLSPLWTDRIVGELLRIAEDREVSLYITTSRRTSPATEARLKALCQGNDRVAMLLLASQSDDNPVPGILGACQKIFCTEDSVSMISEAATAGTNVYLLRVGRKKGWRRILQGLTERLVGWRLLSERSLWGAPRFDRMIDQFIERGLIAEMPSDVAAWRSFLQSFVAEPPQFNEARRAARWILENWR